MGSWPRIAALALLAAALLALMIFQWLPALGFFPAAGALLAWEHRALKNPAARAADERRNAKHWPK